MGRGAGRCKDSEVQQKALPPGFLHRLYMQLCRQAPCLFFTGVRELASVDVCALGGVLPRRGWGSLAFLSIRLR